MNKYAWVIFSILMVGVLVKIIVDTERKDEQKRIDQEQSTLERKRVLSNYSSTYNAVMDWESKLGNDGSIRLGEVLSVELERLWQQDRPILFLGNIKDIVTYSDSEYMVTVEQGLVSHSSMLIGTNIQLSVIAKKEIIDSFLEKNTNILKKFKMHNEIAFVAKIENIASKQLPSDSGNTNNVKIGEGVLLALKYIGEP